MTNTVEKETTVEGSGTGASLKIVTVEATGAGLLIVVKTVVVAVEAAGGVPSRVSVVLLREVSVDVAVIVFVLLSVAE